MNKYFLHSAVFNTFYSTFFIQVGDYVLVKCHAQNEELEKIFYVPGIVQVSPLKMKATDNFYTIIRYDTKKVGTVLLKLHSCLEHIF